jgi:hypothetical protein
MNWYKRAQAEFEMDGFDDRNRLNEKIRRLEGIAAMLSYASRLIFQTQRGARLLVQQAMAEKSLSSYPQVIEILGQADSVALDSPYKFSDYCLASMDEIVIRAKNLKRQREDWTNEGGPKKGLF